MPALRPEQARQVATAAAVARIGVGVLALVRPGPICRLWVGPDGDRLSARMLGRVIGGRELALGLGTLLALRHEGPVRGWLEASSLADGLDFVVTASRFGDLAPFGRWLFLVGAAAASATEALAAQSVDD